MLFGLKGMPSPRCPSANTHFIQSTPSLTTSEGRMVVKWKRLKSKECYSEGEKEVEVSRQNVSCVFHPPPFAALHSAVLSTDPSRNLLPQLRSCPVAYRTPGGLLTASLEQLSISQFWMECCRGTHKEKSYKVACCHK